MFGLLSKCSYSCDEKTHIKNFPSPKSKFFRSHSKFTPIYITLNVRFLVIFFCSKVLCCISWSPFKFQSWQEEDYSLLEKRIRKKGTWSWCEIWALSRITVCQTGKEEKQGILTKSKGKKNFANSNIYVLPSILKWKQLLKFTKIGSYLSSSSNLCAICLEKKVNMEWCSNNI